MRTDKSKARPFDLYLAPEENGHYRNFFEVVSSWDAGVDSIFKVMPGGLRGLREVIELRNGRRPRFVHLILGERDLVLGLLLRMCGFQITAIFYRVPHKPVRGAKTRLARMALHVARYAGIITMSLERPLTMALGDFDAVLQDVYDFAALDGIEPVEPLVGEQITFLIAGYIDRRKMADQIIRDLALLAPNYDKRFLLRLVGKIEQSQRSKILTAVNEVSRTGLAVQILDERVTNTRLRNEMAQADVVMATYVDHPASSGMVVNALALRRPVLFFPYGALEEFAGMIPDAEQPSSVQDIPRCIDAVLENPARYRLGNLDYQAYLVDRSTERYAHTFHSALSSKRAWWERGSQRH